MFINKMVKGLKKSVKPKSTNKESNPQSKLNNTKATKSGIENPKSAIELPTTSTAAAAAATHRPKSPTAATTAKETAPYYEPVSDDLPSTSKAAAAARIGVADSPVHTGPWKRLERLSIIEEPFNPSGKRTKAMRKRSANWLRLNIAEPETVAPVTAEVAPSSRRPNQLYSDVLASSGRGKGKSASMSPPPRRGVSYNKYGDSDEDGGSLITANLGHFPSLNALTTKKSKGPTQQQQHQHQHQQRSQVFKVKEQRKQPEEHKKLEWLEKPSEHEEPEEHQESEDEEDDDIELPLDYNDFCSSMTELPDLSGLSPTDDTTGGDTTSTVETDTWSSSDKRSTDNSSRCTVSSLRTEDFFDDEDDDDNYGNVVEQHNHNDAVGPMRFKLADTDFATNGVEVEMDAPLFGGVRVGSLYEAPPQLPPSSEMPPQPPPNAPPPSQPPQHSQGINRHVVLEIFSWNFLDLSQPSFINYPRFERQFTDENYLQAEEMSMLSMKLAMGNQQQNYRF